MTAQIVKWGNSQGIRLPKIILDEAGIAPEETVELFIEKGRIMIVKQQRHRTLEERAAEYGGLLGPYERIDWGEPVGREIW
ncbi:MAG: AbrB/MazE/SpoVT family DNA-binding domain-containing protein [Lachnospiraceae bacterium]|jgi:antitoxin MazE|nr:AbrB/MazE/SpoVT family DNA-binding domain-containing protein [Lachnospiraceae bacterium]